MNLINSLIFMILGLVLCCYIEPDERENNKSVYQILSKKRILSIKRKMFFCWLSIAVNSIVLFQGIHLLKSDFYFGSLDLSQGGAISYRAYQASFLLFFLNKIPYFLIIIYGYLILRSLKKRIFDLPYELSTLKYLIRKFYALSTEEREKVISKGVISAENFVPEEEIFQKEIKESDKNELTEEEFILMDEIYEFDKENLKQLSSKVDIDQDKQIAKKTVLSNWTLDEAKSFLIDTKEQMESTYSSRTGYRMLKKMVKIEEKRCGYSFEQIYEKNPINLIENPYDKTLYDRHIDLIVWTAISYFPDVMKSGIESKTDKECDLNFYLHIFYEIVNLSFSMLKNFYTSKKSYELHRMFLHLKSNSDSLKITEGNKRIENLMQKYEIFDDKFNNGIQIPLSLLILDQLQSEKNDKIKKLTEDLFFIFQIINFYLKDKDDAFEMMKPIKDKYRKLYPEIFNTN